MKLKFRHYLLGLFVLVFCTMSSESLLAQQWNIGSGSSSIQPRSNPFCLEAESQRVQFLYTNAELTAAGVTPGNITALAFNIANLNSWNGAAFPYRNFQIRMKNTTLTNLNAGFDNMSGSTTVRSAININNLNGPTATGWYTINFSSNINYTAGNGLLVEICFNSHLAAANEWTPNYPTVIQSTMASNQARRINADNSVSGVCGITGGIAYLERPDIRFIRIACAGAPTPGTITGSATACINSNITLNLTGSSTGGAFNFQWQSNINAGGWNNVGINSTSLTVGFTGVSTLYRVIITCIGGSSSMTPNFTVTPVSFFNCFCTPANTGQGGVGHIKQVIFGGINNNVDAMGAGGYTNNFVAVAPVNISINSANPITVVPGGGLFPGVQTFVWIDYDHNAIFDASERTQLSETGSPNQLYNLFTGTITVPPTALSGTTRMRIRYTWSNLTVPNPSCSAQNNWGEVEDYRVDIAASVACTGTPISGGNTIAGSSAGAQDLSGTTFTGTITGPVFTGRIGSVFTGTINGAVFTGRTGANFTGTINGATFTGSITGTTLTVTAISSGTISTGMTLTGGSIIAGTSITALGTGVGGTGTYIVNNSQTLASTALTGSGNRLTVTAITGGTLSTGMSITGSGILAGTTITGQISGTAGSTGVYTVNNIQTVSSTSIIGDNNILTVTAVTSGTIGVGMNLTGGAILAGTSITSLGTGVGGTGTYILNNPQNLASTSLTGSGTRLTVTAITWGTITTGTTITGTGILAGTAITGQISGTAGSTGVYTVNNSQIVASTLITGANNVLTVTAVASGTITNGMSISGGSIIAGTSITSLGTGTGGNGTYILNNPQTLSSSTITGGGNKLTVSSISSGQVAVGMYLTGTNVAFGTQVTALGTGTGGTGTYTVTPSQLLPSTLFGSTNFVCPSSTIYLSTQTYPNNGGITFQWELSTDAGVTWAIIPGAVLVNATYSGIPLGATYLFRRRTTCTNSGNDATSVPIAVIGNPSYVNCYCTPVMIDNSADRIDRVTFNGYTRISTSDPGRYSNTGTPTSPVSILNIGSTYPVQIQCGPYTGERAAVWIDLNTDADFDDPGEFMGQVQFTSACGIPAGTGPANNIRIINVTVPLGTTPTPYTRLRVRIGDPCQGIPLPSNPWSDACSNVYFGETEDYAIQLDVLPVCSGTPAGGTTVTSNGSPCQGNPFTLSVTGSVTGVVGITYQWEINTGSGWTNILAANSVTFNVNIPPNSGVVQYRRKISCINSGLFDYSSAIIINSISCGCQPSFSTGTSNGFFISNVELENSGLSNSSGANPTSPYYQYFSNVTPGIIQQSAPYWLKVFPGTNIGTHNIGAWIDWNADNDFDDLGEQVGMQATSNNQPVYFLINVPATSTLGLTRLRVRASNTTNALAPCFSLGANYVNGESEDYNIQIEASSCLNGTLPGTIETVLPTEQIVNGEIDITEQVGVGTRIGWEYSADNFVTSLGTYVTYPNKSIINVNPSSPFLYVRGVYQNGGCPVAYSNVSIVKLRCASAFGTSTNTFDNNDVISNVKIKQGAATLLDNSSITNNKPVGYQDFRTISTELYRGTTYQMTVVMNQNGASKPLQVAVWLDNNNDGTYNSTTELLYKSSTPSQTHNFNITMPCSPTDPSNNIVGDVQLRIMCVDTSLAINSDACWNKVPATTSNSYRMGEIEEYTIFLNPVQSLSVNPANAVCVGTTASFTASGASSYVWLPTTNMTPANGLGASVSVTDIGIDPIYYTVTGVLPNGCAANNVVAAATLPKGGVVSPSSSIVCNNTSKVFTVTGSAGEQNWQISSDNITWTPAPGAILNSLTYTLTNITSTKYVRCISKSLCYDIASSTAVVNVATTPAVTVTPLSGTTAQVDISPFGPNQYNVSWSGAGTGNVTSISSNPFTIGGAAPYLPALNPNTNLTVTVTLATPVCAVSPTVVTVKTQCAKPTLTVVNNPAAPGTGAILTWTGPIGNYEVQYRGLYSNGNWLTTTVAGVNTKTFPALYSNEKYAFRVRQLACSVGVDGEYSNTKYLMTNPVSSCTPEPVVVAPGTTSCSNQLVVSVTGGTGPYRVVVRRISPNPTAGIAYTLPSPNPAFALTINATFTNSIWEVTARTICSGSPTTYSTSPDPVIILLKSPCPAIENLVVSNVDCYGADLSWSPSACPGILSHYVYIKKSTQLNYSAYNVGGASVEHVDLNFLGANGIYSAFVRTLSCNNSVSANSNVVTFTTAAPGCGADLREDDEPIVSVGDESEATAVYPNPANTGYFFVDIVRSNTSEAPVMIELVNAIGQVMQTNFGFIDGGHYNELVKYDNNISEGIYLVRVHVGENVYVNRLVISKN
jgi:hypothetical protein